MDTLAIGRLQTRFRTSSPRDRGRLLRLPDQLLEHALTEAATAAGLFANEHLCVRRLAVQIRFDLREPDEALLSHWAAEIATELAEQLRGGRSDRVLRYPSRRVALLDLVLSVVGGDRQRAWAWRQLGFGVDGSDATVIFTALRRAPEATAVVLDEARRRHALPRLVSMLAAAEWTTLAAEALTYHQLPPAWSEITTLRRAEREWTPTRPGAPMRATPDAAASDRTAPIDTPIDLLVGQALASPLGAALRALAWRLDPERCAALTVLLALGVIPARLAALGADARRGLARLLERLTAPDAPRALEPGAPEADRVARSADPAPPVAEPRPDLVLPEAIAARPEGWSDHGGLLFLIHLLTEHVEALLEAAPDRPLSWILHALALHLLDLAEDDPAALAFAGLPPDAPPPTAPRAGSAPQPIRPAEEAGIAAIAAALRAGLAAQIKDLPLEAICARRALIVADPGWFSVHLALDSVDVAVRRAGLDLDLGHVPWLGVVVEFVYA